MKSLIFIICLAIMFSILDIPKYAPQQIVKIGTCKVSYINDDGPFVPTLLMYPTSDAETWKQHEELTDGKGNLLLPFGGFLIESGKKKIIMDLGFGPEKMDFPGFGLVSGGSLLKNLESAGAKPEDITDVFLTHMHIDHCGWTSIFKDGKYQLTFPNANYWVSKEEWDFWLKTEAPFGKSEVDDFFRKAVMDPLKGVIKFIEDGQQMAPYLTAHKVPGHTPGLSILKLETEGKVLWFTSDIFHTVVQITERKWYAIFDIDPKAAEVTRKKMLPEFLKENAFLANGHFSNYVFGKLTGEDGNLKWTPCTTKECKLNSNLYKTQEDL